MNTLKNIAFFLFLAFVAYFVYAMVQAGATLTGSN